MKYCLKNQIFFSHDANLKMLKKSRAKEEINTEETKLAKNFQQKYLDELNKNLADQKKLMELKYENTFIIKFILNRFKNFLPR